MKHSIDPQFGNSLEMQDYCEHCLLYMKLSIFMKLIYAILKFQILLADDDDEDVDLLDLADDIEETAAADAETAAASPEGGAKEPQSQSSTTASTTESEDEAEAEDFALLGNFYFLWFCSFQIFRTNTLSTYVK